MSQLTFTYCKQTLTRKNALQKGMIPAEYQGQGCVYLLHFDKPIGSKKHKAQHYVGFIREWADPNNLQRRLKQHKKGNGKNCSRITSAAIDQGRKLKLANVWEGVNQDFEKYLKSWKCNKEFCPVCQDIPFL